MGHTRLKSTTPQRLIYYKSGNPNHLWMEREMILPRGLDIFSAQLTSRCLMDGHHRLKHRLRFRGRCFIFSHVRSRTPVIICSPY